MIKIGKKVSSTHFSSCNKERSEGCEAKKITWKYAVQDYCKRDGLSRRLALQHLHSEVPHFVSMQLSLCLWVHSFSSFLSNCCRQDFFAIPRICVHMFDCCWSSLQFHNVCCVCWHTEMWSMVLFLVDSKSQVKSFCKFSIGETKCCNPMSYICSPMCKLECTCKGIWKPKQKANLQHWEKGILFLLSKKIDTCKYGTYSCHICLGLPELT